MRGVSVTQRCCRNLLWPSECCYSSSPLSQPILPMSILASLFRLIRSGRFVMEHMLRWHRVETLPPKHIVCPSPTTNYLACISAYFLIMMQLVLEINLRNHDDNPANAKSCERHIGLQAGFVQAHNTWKWDSEHCPHTGQYHGCMATCLVTPHGDGKTAQSCKKAEG